MVLSGRKLVLVGGAVALAVASPFTLGSSFRHSFSAVADWLCCRDS